MLRFERPDVIIALGLAGLINMAMLAVAAKLFHGAGLTGVDTIQGAHPGFGNLVGGRRRARLRRRAVRLGRLVVERRHLRRAGRHERLRQRQHLRSTSGALVTMVPALVVLAVGVSPTSALVLSQVVLSFGIPFALDPARHAHDAAGT